MGGGGWPEMQLCSVNGFLLDGKIRRSFPLCTWRWDLSIHCIGLGHLPPLLHWIFCFFLGLSHAPLLLSHPYLFCLLFLFPFRLLRWVRWVRKKKQYRAYFPMRIASSPVHACMGSVLQGLPFTSQVFLSSSSSSTVFVWFYTSSWYDTGKHGSDLQGVYLHLPGEGEGRNKMLRNYLCPVANWLGFVII